MLSHLHLYIATHSTTVTTRSWTPHCCGFLLYNIAHPRAVMKKSLLSWSLSSIATQSKASMIRTLVLHHYDFLIFAFAHRKAMMTRNWAPCCILLLSTIAHPNFMIRRSSILHCHGPFLCTIADLRAASSLLSRSSFFHCYTLEGHNVEVFGLLSLRSPFFHCCTPQSHNEEEFSFSSSWTSSFECYEEDNQGVCCRRVLLLLFYCKEDDNRCINHGLLVLFCCRLVFLVLLQFFYGVGFVFVKCKVEKV